MNIFSSYSSIISPFNSQVRCGLSRVLADPVSLNKALNKDAFWPLYYAIYIPVIIILILFLLQENCHSSPNDEIVSSVC